MKGQGGGYHRIIFCYQYVKLISSAHYKYLSSTHRRKFHHQPDCLLQSQMQSEQLLMPKSYSQRKYGNVPLVNNSLPLSSLIIVRWVDSLRSVLKR